MVADERQAGIKWDAAEGTLDHEIFGFAKRSIKPFLH
jgi:hypothetical protein